MPSEQCGPDALVGATGAGGIQCSSGTLNTPTKAALQAVHDGRTRLGRAFRSFQALPDQERARILLGLVIPTDGKPWTVRQAAERTGIPAEIILLALMTCGDANPLD